MKRITKLVAAASSVMMLASMGSLSVPAFAEEYVEMQAEEYASTFENEDAQKVAKYLLENGVSQEEADQMMTHYLHGLAMMEENADVATASTNATSKVAFYSTNNIASSQHYGMFIIDDPKVETFTTLKLTYNTSSVTYDYGTKSAANHINLNDYTEEHFTYSNSSTSGKSTILN